MPKQNYTVNYRYSNINCFFNSIYIYIVIIQFIFRFRCYNHPISRFPMDPNIVRSSCKFSRHEARSYGAVTRIWSSSWPWCPRRRLGRLERDEDPQDPSTAKIWVLFCVQGVLTLTHHRIFLMEIYSDLIFKLCFLCHQTFNKWCWAVWKNTTSWMGFR